MTVESKLSDQFIYCECGCKTKIPKYNNKGKLRHYFNGHERKGKTYEHRIDTKLKLRNANLGSKNPMFGKKRDELKGSNNPAWKGNEVGYSALHVWVKKYIPKTNLCIVCKQKYQILHLANISGLYLRDVEDWVYLCHKCHFRFDKLKRRIEDYID